MIYSVYKRTKHSSDKGDWTDDFLTNLESDNPIMIGELITWMGMQGGYRVIDKIILAGDRNVIGTQLVVEESYVKGL